MQGKCLCGGVQFVLSGELPNLYQCHCSLCRKVTGSSANAAFRIDLAQLSWIEGEAPSVRIVALPLYGSSNNLRGRE